MAGQDVEERHIENAVTAWARTVFSAPRRFHELVTGVESRDDVIERVATHIVRRELREVRTATAERRGTRPRVDPSSVDPFVHTHDTLKADSEYIAQCAGCRASGLMVCGPCHGTGHGRCPGCHGTGKVPSPKTGRPIQCKSCRATGSAPCRNCAGQGSVHCRACMGSGHQLAWLTFEAAQRWEVAVPTSNPIVVSHPALQHGRPMAPADLATMTTVLERSRPGPLDLQELPEPDRQTVGRQLRNVDPRLERVQFQQYLKLAALRRDVTFEMCGTTATLSLTGTQLVGATTPEVLRPIRRRLHAWIALGTLVGLAGLALRSSMLGSSSYFDAASNASAVLVAAALGCAIPALGAVLRSWRGGLRFHPIRLTTRLWSAGAGTALVAIAVLGIAVRPDPADVQRAIAANDLARARAIVRALQETRGETPDTAELEDRVTLAEAGKLRGQARLELLDAVAARRGAAAGGAAADARAQRLDEVRQLIAAQRPTEALAVLARFFADDRSVPVAEERARTHDASLTSCPTAACQLGEAILARDARSTPERVAAVAAARERVAAALGEQITAGETLSRLQQLRKLHDAGVATTKVASDDADLQARAHRAIDTADAGRAAVPLLGNDLAVAEELLAASTSGPGGGPAIALDGVTVFLSLDRKGRCTGIYAVGDKAAGRAIKSDAWPSTRLLSQAVGRPSPLQPPAGQQPTTRWYAGGTPVVARWLAGAPIELRIGDATP
jgi:hypothetical protein